MNNKFTQNNFRIISIAPCWENRQEKWHDRACCRIFYDSLLSIPFSYTSNHQSFLPLLHCILSHRNILNTPLMVSHWLTADERKKGVAAQVKKGNTCKHYSTGSNKKEDCIKKVQQKNSCITSETNHNSHPCLSERGWGLVCQKCNLFF